MLLGCFSMTWFKAEIIAGGDEGLPPPKDILWRSLYLWDSYNPSLGSLVIVKSVNSPPQSLIIPYALYWTLTYLLNIPLPLADRIWVYILFTLPGLTIYYLASIIGIKSKLSRFVAAMLYMFNPYLSYALTGDGALNTALMVQYGISPLLLALFIEGIQCRNIKYSIYIGLVSIFASVCFSNPPRYIILWIPSFLYIVFALIVMKDRRIFIITFSALTLGLIILFNMYWLIGIPFVLQLNLTATLSTTEWVFWNTIEAKLINIFRMLGFWAWKQYAFGSPYFPYYHFYDHPFVIICAFLLIILACAALVVNKTLQTLFFSLLLIIGIFFSKGPNPPLGEIFIWLYNNVPYFWIFRSPVIKFEQTVVLSIAILLGLTTDYLFSITEIIKKFIIFLSILILIVSNSLPVFSGDVIPTTPRGGRGLLPGFQVNIPDYWKEFIKYVEIQSEMKTGRTLLVPPVWYAVITNWGYGGPDPALMMVSAPFVSKTMNRGSFESDKVIELLYNCSILQYINITYLLNILNIRYILYREEDFSVISRESTISFCWNKILRENSNFALVKRWGPLLLYENKLWKPLNIYAATKIILVKDLNDMLKFLDKNISVAQIRETAILIENQLNSIQISNLSLKQVNLCEFKNIVELKYTKINPIKYIIHVNTSCPFILVFSESYHKGWVAYVKGKRLPDTWHLIANGYANAWYINEIGTYDIILEFWPQRLCYIGTLISFITFFFCILYLIRKHLKIERYYLNLLCKTKKV
jgi:hypothetical protein